MNVFIVGITGVGKSLLGKKLARSLQMNFIDLDAWIQIREKKTISEMFEISEEYFRKAEQEALFHIPARSPHVISTGGGIVLNSENIEFMKQNGMILYLYRSIDEIAKHINIEKRPLLKDRNTIYRLFNERKSIYEACADFAVDCSNKRGALSEMQRFIEENQLNFRKQQEGRNENQSDQRTESEYVGHQRIPDLRAGELGGFG